MRGSPVRVRLSALSRIQESELNILTLFFKLSGISSVGRALASQAEGRGFESRNPLLQKEKNEGKVKKTAQKFAGFKK